jgi:hypothetical protein
LEAPGSWSAYIARLDSEHQQQQLVGTVTGVNVVAKHSYGRQIGRISDALRALILERHPNPPETGPFAQFISMWEEIEQVKSESATARLEQIASDLALLKDKDHSEYTRLRDALRRALKQTE